MCCVPQLPCCGICLFPYGDPLWLNGPLYFPCYIFGWGACNFVVMCVAACCKPYFVNGIHNFVEIAPVAPYYLILSYTLVLNVSFFPQCLHLFSCLNWSCLVFERPVSLSNSWICNSPIVMAISIASFNF